MVTVKAEEDRGAHAQEGGLHEGRGNEIPREPREAQPGGR